MSPTTPPSGWPDQAIAEIAARQATMVHRRQLRGLGVSPSAIDRALARGRLHRSHRGVYSLVRVPARPPLAGVWGAVLAVGSRAVISHLTAAALLGLTLETEPGLPLHVIDRAGHHRSRPGLLVHRTRSLPPSECHRLSGLPVTSLARTTLDVCAMPLERDVRAAVVDRAIRRGARGRLRAVLAAHPEHPGRRALAELLDPRRPSADAWSRAERRLLALIRRAGLPMPSANERVGRYIPDLLWRELRVIVEYDSEFHVGPAAERWDTARHNELTSLGWSVLHVTYEDLYRRPEQTLARIAVALAFAQAAGSR